MIFLRVAIIHHALGRFGGAERMSVLHTIHLNLMGIETDLYYNGPILKEWEEMVREYTNFYKLPFGLRLSYKNLRDIISTKNKLENYDVVLFHHHVDPFMAYYLVKNLKTKTVWYCGEPLRALWEDVISGIPYGKLKKTVRKTSEESFGKTVTRIFLTDFSYDLVIKILRKIDIYTAKLYDMIITNSNYTRYIVNKVYNIHNNVKVVYPGIDIKKFKSFDKSEMEFPLSSEDRYILAIGAFIPMKNYETLIESYSMLPNYIRRECKLVIIGDGVLKKHILIRAENLGIKDDLIIISSVSDRELFSFYNYCDFVIHIALHEPFGLIPVEAGYFSKPAIVSNVGGTCETVVDGETGYVVNPKNPKEIKNKMTRLLEDDNLRKRMGKNARKRVLNEFTIEKSTERLLKIIEVILK